MGARKGPKIEVRSRTGAPYSRSGERWSSAWRDVPDELVKDDAKMDIIAADPHLEIRVDGEFVTGPRKGQRARSEGEAAPLASRASASDQGELASLRERNVRLEQQLEEAHVENERLRQAPDHGDFAELVGLSRDTAQPAVLTAIHNGLADTRAYAFALGLPETATPGDILAKLSSVSHAAPPAAPTTPDTAAAKKK